MNEVNFIFTGENPYKLFYQKLETDPITEMLDREIVTSENYYAVYFVPDDNEILSVVRDGGDQIPTRPSMVIQSWLVPEELGGGVGFKVALIVNEYFASKSPITFTITATGKTNETSSPATRLFAMDRDNLRDLAEEDLYTYSWGLGSSTGGTSKDSRMVDYIINLLMIPFEIPEEYKDVETEIVLGDYTLPIIAPVLSSDLIEVSLGSIVVPEIGNSLDFEGVEYELFLPFVSDTVILPNNLLVGKTLEVVYLVDLYSGSTTINIYNGGIEPIKSIKSILGRSIPIKVEERTVISIGDDSGIVNGFNYIYLRKTSPELMNGIFNNLVTVNGLLSEADGFTVIENMILKTKANYDEQQQILNILKSGVIINE